MRMFIFRHYIWRDLNCFNPLYCRDVFECEPVHHIGGVPSVLIPFIAGMFLNHGTGETTGGAAVLIPFIAGMFLNEAAASTNSATPVLIPFIAGMFLNRQAKPNHWTESS